MVDKELFKKSKDKNGGGSSSSTANKDGIDAKLSKNQKRRLR